jgi:ABC-type microcin C transport system permease subunit YejB
MLFGIGKKFNSHKYSLSPDELAMERAACFNQPRSVKNELLIVKISMAISIPLFSLLMYYSVPIAIVIAVIVSSASFSILHGRVSIKAACVPALSSIAGLLLGYFLFVPLVSLISDFIREYY